MVINLGGTDRSIRIVLGAALCVGAILIGGHPRLGVALGVAGALLILGGACGT